MGDTKLVSPSNKEDNFKSICVSLLSAYSKGGMGIFQCEMLGGILVVFFFFSRWNFVFTIFVEGPAAARAFSDVTYILVHFSQWETEV